MSLRQRFVKVKNQNKLSYRNLEDMTGIHNSVLQQFGQGVGVLSKESEIKLALWVEEMERKNVAKVH